MFPHLQHGDEVDVIPVYHLIHEAVELLQESLIICQPRGMEVQPERGPVAIKVPLKVVLQHVPELDPVEDVGTRGDHVTTRQGLIKIWVIPPVELIDDHLPDRMGPRRAVLSIAVALMRHAVVEGVRPDGDTAERRGDGCVIDKELVGHHLKLLVASDTEVGCPDSDHGSISDVCKAFNNQPRPGHLCQPVIVRSLGPVISIIFIRDGKHPDLVTFSMELLNRGVVGVLVRNVKCSFKRTPVRILSLPIK